MSSIDNNGRLQKDQPVLEEDEYINPVDNLIYCSKCHTPREKKIFVMGKEFTPRLKCKCQREAAEEQEKVRKRYEDLEKIKQNRHEGLKDPLYRDYTFENDNGLNSQMSFAHNYVVNWAEMYKKSEGLLLWGDVGTGKSFMAGCIANALLDQGETVLMTNLATVLNTIAGKYPGDRNEYIESLNKYSLLIIDDLGIERTTEFAAEQLFNLIDSRYRSKKPMIITTNLSIRAIKGEETSQGLKNELSISYKRIFDRILERCVPICINDNSMRNLNAKKNFEETKDLLVRPGLDA